MYLTYSAESNRKILYLLRQGQGIIWWQQNTILHKELECKEQKLMLASSRRSDSRAGKKKYDEEKKVGENRVFSSFSLRMI